MKYQIYTDNWNPNIETQIGKYGTILIVNVELLLKSLTISVAISDLYGFLNEIHSNYYSPSRYLKVIKTEWATEHPDK